MSWQRFEIYVLHTKCNVKLMYLPFHGQGFLRSWYCSTQVLKLITMPDHTPKQKGFQQHFRMFKPEMITD
jgi:alpha-D-ribose 1-methylphosphonate 5-triphosphate diphosphatase PhnM